MLGEDEQELFTQGTKKEYAQGNETIEAAGLITSEQQDACLSSVLVISVALRIYVTDI